MRSSNVFPWQCPRTDTTLAFTATGSDDDPYDFHTASVCPERDGLDVATGVMNDDSWLVLRSETRDWHDWSIFRFNISGRRYNFTGDKLEWRHDDCMLKALIVWVSGDDPRSPNRRHRYLAIGVDVRVGRFIGLTDTVEQARDLVDQE